MQRSAASVIGLYVAQLPAQSQHVNRFRAAISALCQLMTNPNLGSTRLAVTFVALSMVGFGSPQRLHAIPVT